jgi:sarcosine oxidase
MAAWEVIVVGGGAMGAATAWHLARRGSRVLLLERFEPGHTRGSSHGGARIFRVAYRDERYVGLAVEALHLWRALEADAGEPLLDLVGQLDHGAAQAIDEIEQALRRARRPVVRLRPAEAAERWPGMRFGEAVLWSPDGGRCRADAAVLALHRRAAAHGAQVRTGTAAERLEVRAHDRVAVHTAAGVEEASSVVVAAGAWLPSLAGGLVPLPPATVTSEQPAHFRRRDGAEEWPSFLHHTSGHADARLAFASYGMWTPGLGVKVGLEGTGVPVDPETRDPAPRAHLVHQLQAYVQEWLPGLDPDPVEVSTCLWTGLPGDQFCVDRRGPVVVCSPCSGHGFKFVPAIGRMAADLALGGPQPEPVWRLPG